MISAAKDTSSRTARDALRDEGADLSEPLAQELDRLTTDQEVADDNR